MKVLYVGHYREGSGWSEAAINYILSLDAAGVEVVCRPVKLNDTKPELPQRILELEQRNLSDVTHVIQHVLPHYMDFNSQFKNIGMMICETDSFGFSGWADSLKMCDEIWVPNTDSARVAKSFTDKMVRVVPHATDTEKYNQQVEPFNDIPELKDRFVFYMIGEYNRRKHLTALLRAFHSEFDLSDNVQLVLKVNKPGWNRYDLENFCRESSRAVKQQLRKFHRFEYYHDELYFCDYLTEEELAKLHKTCDCFVNTSFGEAWSYPTFDAMGYGNLVISSDCGGMKDYLSGPGLLVPGNMEPCFGADPPFIDIHTANEKWYNINIIDLQNAMRQAYEMTTEKAVKSSWGKRSAQNYSYEKVGKIMKGALEC